MIRMGKSSKTQDSNQPAELQEQAPNSVLSEQRSSGALSESELLARDIKEGRLSGFVGSGTVLTGETSFQTMLRIDGHLKGEIRSDDGTLIVGATGRIDANVYVSEAIINGAVNGDITALNKLTLGRAARVVGDIHTARLIIEDGAILEGSCSMVKSIEAQEQRIAESQHQIPVHEDSYPKAPEEETEEISVEFEISDDDDTTEPETNSEAASN